jgi:hypothetical protein
MPEALRNSTTGHHDADLMESLWKKLPEVPAILSAAKTDIKNPNDCHSQLLPSSRSTRRARFERRRPMTDSRGWRLAVVAAEPKESPSAVSRTPAGVRSILAGIEVLVDVKRSSQA